MLTKEQIDCYLHELNERLELKGLSGEIVICGGAVMSLVFDARPATKDIDALFAPTGAIREIVNDMAKEHGLPSDWLNDAAKGFIDTSRMGFVDVMALNHLTVRRPDNREMLALKLAAAREDSSDAGDALFLMKLVRPSSLEEVYEIIETHIPHQRLTPLAHFFAQEIYKRYSSGF